MVKAHPACTPDGIEARLENGATVLGDANSFGAGLVDPVQANTVPGC
jgi:hypothetical protein